MMKGNFSKEEVVSYLESTILDQTASEYEEEVYLNFKWENKLSKNTYALKQVLKNMRREYEGE